GAQAMIITAPPLSKVAVDCAQAGYMPHYTTVDGFGISPSVMKSNSAFNGVVSGLSGFPTFKEFPATADFFAAIKEYYPQYLTNSAQNDIFVNGLTGGSQASLAW